MDPRRYPYCSHTLVQLYVSLGQIPNMLDAHGTTHFPPLQRKSSGVGGAQRHGSAPSLVSPSPDPSPSHVESGGSGQTRQTRELEPVPRAQPVLHSSSSGDLRPRRLVALHDSPLTQHKAMGRKSSRRSPTGAHGSPLQSTPSSTSPPKQSMAVH